jgi:transcriptional regulator of arginine metabolism
VNKSYRQGQILKLIRSKKLHTQDELARALRTIGIPATQVTLSRDIRDLSLVKTPDGYVLAAEAPTNGPDVETVVREFVLDIRIAQNLLVLRTPPGHANSVGVVLDKANWREIAGTIAGDDTILVIAPDTKTAAALREKFLRFLK